MAKIHRHVFENPGDKVLDSLYEKVTVFDENYGDTRNLLKSLGGYCVVFPTIEDQEQSYQTILDKHYIQKELHEYQEEIVDEGCFWIEELYMISSDYAIDLEKHKNKTVIPV